MKKFSLIYVLSFLPYVFEWLRIGDYRFDLILSILSVIAFIYQLLYIFKLGRKDNVSARKSAGRFFLYLFLSISISVIITYIGIYFNGYTEYAFISGRPSTYYGAEAWDKYSNSLYFPKQILGFSAAYAVTYFIVSIICKKRKETNIKMNKTEKITFLTILPLLIMLFVIIFAFLASNN